MNWPEIGQVLVEASTVVCVCGGGGGGDWITLRIQLHHSKPTGMTNLGTEMADNQHFQHVNEHILVHQDQFSLRV